DRIFQNDKEAFVRLASEVVLRQKFDSYFYQLKQYKDARDAPWFADWEHDQREYGLIAYDAEPEDVVDFAFSQTDNPTIRWLMTGIFGQIGRYDKLEQIYQALEDRNDTIRDMAYRTLSIFQERLGQPIPAPIS